MTKENENTDLMEALCAQLNDDFAEVLGFNPGLSFHGNMNYGAYMFACEKHNGDGSMKIELKFGINYLGRNDVLTREDLNTRTNEELIALADERRDIDYVHLNYFGVTPQRQEFGTKLMHIFFNKIQEMQKIKRIYLNPENEDSRRFWVRLGFVERNSVPQVPYTVPANLVKVL